MSQAWATAVCAGRGIGGDAIYLPCFHARILENEVSHPLSEKNQKVKEARGFFFLL